MITGIGMASIYVTDFEEALRFYTEILGLEKAFDMGDQACYFALGEQGLYLRGGCTPSEYTPDTARLSFTFDVDSISELWNTLKENGVRTVENEPVQMGEEMWWCRFYDPQGNILEALGGK